MRLSYQKFYTITLLQPETGQVEFSHVVLHKRDYKKMLKQLNEIVFIDDRGEWALKQIELK